MHPKRKLILDIFPATDQGFSQRHEILNFNTNTMKEWLKENITKKSEPYIYDCSLRFTGTQEESAGANF